MTEPIPPPSGPASLDALLPPAMAERAEQVGVKKAGLPALPLLTLAVLAGAFIALGAVFSTTVSAGAASLPYGIARLCSGVAFSLGLVLVIVGGAELFTGNSLIVMAWASGKVPAVAVLRNWGLVYLGNFVGAAATAGFVVVSRQWTFGGGQVGAAALAIAEAKGSLDFLPAVALGALCNALVCLAVWLCFSARSAADKVLVIVPPIAAFVAAGFEHSVANMYFFPVAIGVKAFAPMGFWSALGKTAADFPSVTWERFLVGNLLPVTLGNLLGGTVMVGAVYWSVYLRGAKKS